MRRESVSIDGEKFFLAQGLDLPALKESVVDAVRLGGDLVEMTLVGNRSVSVLVGPTSRLHFDSAEVDEDPRDDGNELLPFDPDLFD